ncbi:tRNA adenosine deaminase-associated protein [Microbispora sp. H11081]|uniref:tRNA adenosine deaminase-associated protein n=1 Tax=Microbispora sp. H11081 TaxID=2729107 RepID=UPI0014731EB4|nr:tRNA adenosine deaminase-associated protein [Microbispora sp. H11081]
MPSRSNLFSAGFARIDGRWTGAEVDLGEAEIADDLSDALQEALGLSGDELALLCVEVEDEWFAIIRYQDDLDPRVFISDAHAVQNDPLGEIFAELAGAVVDKDAPDLGIRPVGDIELLVDFSLSAEELVELSMEEGVLPADILSLIAERLGFADELDRLR